MPSSEKAEMMLANFVIPLCLRIGGNDRGKATVLIFCCSSLFSYTEKHSSYSKSLFFPSPAQCCKNFHFALPCLGESTLGVSILSLLT